MRCTGITVIRVCVTTRLRCIAPAAGVSVNLTDTCDTRIPSQWEVFKFSSLAQAHKKLVEERNLEMARKSKEHAEKLKVERLKMMENYEEPEWMKMSNVEESLQQIEAHLDQSHGGETGVRGNDLYTEVDVL